MAGKLDVAATPTKPAVDARPEAVRAAVSVWPNQADSASGGQKPSSRDALQALLAFSALHDQVRRRKALAAKYSIFDAPSPAEFEPEEMFALDEVLQVVAERAVAITGADGLAIALADNNEILLRAAAGPVCPDVGARIDRDSAFSGACFRTAQVIRCDDTETDARVNLAACRRLGARSMVAVPLCGRRRVIGVLEAFSAEPMGFNESDVRNLELLAEIILGALKPVDEDRFASSASVAVTGLAPILAPESVATEPIPPSAVVVSIPIIPSPVPVQASIPAPVETPVLGSPAVVAEPIVPPPALHLVEPTVPAIADPAATEAAQLTSAIEEPVAVIPAPVESVKAASEPEAVTDGGPSKVALPEVFDPIVEDISSDETKIQDVTPAEIKESPAAIPQEAFAFDSLTPAAPTSRPSVILLLVLVVVAAVAAAAVWWKGTTAQIGRAMIHRAPNASVRRDVPAGAGATTPTPAGAAITPSAKPATVSDTSSPDAGLDGATPATPQEISHMPRVNGLRHWSSADASTVTLDLDDQVQYEAHRLSNPERIYFDLHDTALAPALANKIEEVGDVLLTRVRLAQPVPGITRLVLETRGAATFSVSLEPSPYRLVVTIRKPGTESKPRAELFPDKPKLKLSVRNLPSSSHRQLKKTCSCALTSPRCALWWTPDTEAGTLVLWAARGCWKKMSLSK